MELKVPTNEFNVSSMSAAKNIRGADPPIGSNNALKTQSTVIFRFTLTL